MLVFKKESEVEGKLFIFSVRYTQTHTRTHTHMHKTGHEVGQGLCGIFYLLFFVLSRLRLHHKNLTYGIEAAWFMSAIEA